MRGCSASGNRLRASDVYGDPWWLGDIVEGACFGSSKMCLGLFLDERRLYLSPLLRVASRRIIIGAWLRCVQGFEAGGDR